jgi:carbonic anhydrase/acetyltransferase-like protein (isoleucine patch superfamily)
MIDGTAFVAPNATIVGRVQINQRSRIMYGAVIDSEGSRIEIGECTVICENAVLRATACGDDEYPLVIGDHVFISPHSTLLGCTIEPGCYLATGTTVLQGAKIYSGSVVAVGAFVHAKTVVPGGFFVPPYSIAIGDPLKLYSPDQKDELTNAIKAIGFAKVAFDVDASWENAVQRYKKITEVRSKEFESHFDDVILEE